MKSKGPFHNLLQPPVVVLAGGMLTAAPLGSHVAIDRASVAARQQIPDRRGVCVFHDEHVLGTSLELKIAATPEQAHAARAAVLAEIARLDGILSAYRGDSEFCRWQGSTGTVRVSAELFGVLERYDLWRARTGGALDASAEAAARLWKTAASRGHLPSRAEREAAARLACDIHWQLDRESRTATHLSEAPLVLNSIAKPYIADRAAAIALAAPGVTGVVVNIGGDLVVRGAWTEPVHIADPFSDAENSPPAATLPVSNRAVATSGSYRRGVNIAGRHYSHVLDPRTAEPVDHIASASVVAPEAADAGALATAFSVMSVEQSRTVAAALPGVEFLLIAKDGRRMASGGWTVPAPAHFAPAAQASPLWDPSFALVIGLELPRFQEIPYHRPYVAVWIEDKDRVLVRTVALWYDQDAWLHELRAWHRAWQGRAAAEKPNLASISSATRPAGKYSFQWDGKDSQGRLVRAGAYTVCIEVVRQSAEYEIFRQPMEFARIPKEIQLTGKFEVSSISLQYRKANGK